MWTQSEKDDHAHCSCFLAGGCLFLRGGAVACGADTGTMCLCCTVPRAVPRFVFYVAYIKHNRSK